jgi:hypothetical protein
MSILLGLLTQFWPYIVGAIGLGWAALKLRQSGAAAERAKQAAAEAKARDVADDVQNDIGAMSPEQRREELRKWAR